MTSEQHRINIETSSSWHENEKQATLQSRSFFHVKNRFWIDIKTTSNQQQNVIALTQNWKATRNQHWNLSKSHSEIFLTSFQNNSNLELISKRSRKNENNHPRKFLDGGFVSRYSSWNDRKRKSFQIEWNRFVIKLKKSDCDDDNKITFRRKIIFNDENDW